MTRGFMLLLMLAEATTTVEMLECMMLRKHFRSLFDHHVHITYLIINNIIVTLAESIEIFEDLILEEPQHSIQHYGLDCTTLCPRLLH